MRASVYLTSRAMALYEAIKFFSNSKSNKLIFLAQIDFWDFEIDTLIYCFSSFSERDEVWNNLNGIEHFLIKQKFIANRKILDDFVLDAKIKRLYLGKRDKVVAPKEALDKCLDEWNHLIESCQSLLIGKKMNKTAQLCGAKIDCDLSKYKKTNQ